MERVLLFRHELQGNVISVSAGIASDLELPGVVAIIPSLQVKLIRDSDNPDRMPMYQWMGLWTQQFGRSVENPTAEELNQPILATVGLPAIDQLVGRTLAVQTPAGDVTFRIGGVTVWPNGDKTIAVIFEQVESWDTTGRSVRIQGPGRSTLFVPDARHVSVPDTAFRLLD